MSIITNTITYFLIICINCFLLVSNKHEILQYLRFLACYFLLVMCFMLLLTTHIFTTALRLRIDLRSRCNLRYNRIISLFQGRCVMLLRRKTIRLMII